MPEATEPRKHEPGQRADDEEQPTRRFPMAVVGWSLAALVLAVYFLWFCIQMAGHAATGGATLIATFGAVAAGLGAGGLAFLFAKRLK